MILGLPNIPAAWEHRDHISDHMQQIVNNWLINKFSFTTAKQDGPTGILDQTA